MIILLRHGQTTANVRLQLDTALPGAPLTELGRKQAAHVSDVVGAAPVVYHSRALRARQTAHYAGGHNLVELPGVEEVSAGDLELRSDSDAHVTYHRAVLGWLKGEDEQIPGGETGQGFFGRYRQAIETVEDDVVVVSHGCAIRAFTAAACGLDPDIVMTRPLVNCEWIGLERVGEFGSWRLHHHPQWIA